MRDGGIWPGPALAGAISLAIAAYSTSISASIVFLSLTLMAGYSMLGPFWATSTELLSETSAVAGIALINSFGNLGGFLGPYTIGLVRTWTGGFRGGLLSVAAVLGVSGFLALLVYSKRAKKDSCSLLRHFGRQVQANVPIASLRPFGAIVYNRSSHSAAGEKGPKYQDKNDLEQPNHNPGSPAPVYWRVEGSLADLTTVRPIAFFTWNAQTFLERWVRRGLVLVMALLRPFLYALNRIFATRVVHTVLRGISRDRLDLLGEEYFKYKLQPYLKADGIEQLKARLDAGDEIVLVSQGLEHVMRPLAHHLGVKWLIANRLEFRDGIATGRLLEPVIRPRGLFAGISGSGPDGRRAAERLVRDLGLPNVRSSGVRRDSRVAAASRADRPIVYFDGVRHTGAAFGPPGARRQARHADRRDRIHRQGLAGQYADGAAGDRADLSADPAAEIQSCAAALRKAGGGVPGIRSAVRALRRRTCRDFCGNGWKWSKATFASPAWGSRPKSAQSLRKNLDLIINSSGLTDFNPDLRDALATNVDAAVNVTEFVRKSDHAGLLHLSTCYVAGARDGRVGENLRPNYTPAGVADFDAEKRMASLCMTS